MARYWFKQKRFGYGCTPNSWQGWALTFAAILAVLVVLLLASHIADPRTRFLVTWLGILGVVAVSLIVSWYKTEGGWRWRNGEKS